MAYVARTINEDCFLNNLLWFDEALKAFQKFSCTFLTGEARAFFNFLVTFDAVMTDVPDYFRYTLHDLKSNERFVGELENSSRQEPQRCANRYKSCGCSGKRVSFPT